MNWEPGWSNLRRERVGPLPAGHRWQAIPARYRSDPGRHSVDVVGNGACGFAQAIEARIGAGKAELEVDVPELGGNPSRYNAAEDGMAMHRSLKSDRLAVAETPIGDQWRILQL